MLSPMEFTQVFIFGSRKKLVPCKTMAPRMTP